MAYPQHLPTYINKFQDFRGWLSKRAGIYHFFYTPKSPAEKDIERIIETQLNSYMKIVSFLNLRAEELPVQIEYYLYPSKELKKELMGDDWFAQAVYNEMRIHAIYTDEIKVIGPHEDTHLLSLPFGLAIGFIQEGLSEYIVGHDWHGNDLTDAAREGIKNKNIKLTPELLYEHKAWLLTDDDNARCFYALAGSFVWFLIDTFGKTKFLEFYRKLDRNRTEKNKSLYVSIFEVDIDSIIIKYKEFIIDK